ncbi:MAG: class II aldolase/adducin family protein [Acidobacteria bacterium]|nr:class II aldolase/adducin family protein [Acidobacteriota bacterium]
MSMKAEIVEIGRRLYSKGLVAGYEGNISVRNGNSILITPSGVCKGFLKEADIIEINSIGEKIAGNGVPSSETALHLKLYRERSDVQAIVHAHPPTATGFACAGLGLDQSLTAETVLMLGAVPLVPYGTPSTEELPEALNGFTGYDALLLANHGAISVGKTLEKAYFLMEQVEQYAKISFVANTLGTPKPLPCDEVDKLMALREKFGIQTGDPTVCSRNGQVTLYRFSRNELVNLIQEILNEVGG